jgi:hypothetical protein
MKCVLENLSIPTPPAGAPWSRQSRLHRRVSIRTGGADRNSSARRRDSAGRGRASGSSSDELRHGYRRSGGSIACRRLDLVLFGTATGRDDSCFDLPRHALMSTVFVQDELAS